MSIRGFAFIPTNAKQQEALPHSVELGTVVRHSHSYRTFAILKDAASPKFSEGASKEAFLQQGARVCRKIQKCLDDLPSFCKEPECWGQNGFRFRRIRIPNTFETANFSKCGNDVFKRCQDILQPYVSRSSSAPEKLPSLPDRAAESAKYQTSITALLTSLIKNPKDFPPSDSKVKEQIKTLLAYEKKGKQIVDEAGFNLMHYLIAYGDEALIEFALKNGGNSNAVEREFGISCLRAISTPLFFSKMVVEFEKIDPNFCCGSDFFIGENFPNQMVSIQTKLISYHADVNEEIKVEMFLTIVREEPRLFKNSLERVKQLEMKPLQDPLQDRDWLELAQNFGLSLLEIRRVLDKDSKGFFNRYKIAMEYAIAHLENLQSLHLPPETKSLTLLQFAVLYQDAMQVELLLAHNAHMEKRIFIQIGKSDPEELTPFEMAIELFKSKSQKEKDILNSMSIENLLRILELFTKKNSEYLKVKINNRSVSDLIKDFRENLNRKKQ